MNSSRIKRRRRNKILKTVIAIFLLIVVALAKDVKADSNNSAEEPKTVHEQLGQSHYPLVQLTTYKSKTEYLGAKKGYWATALHPVFNITHFLFNNVLTNKPALPTGYLAVRNGDTLILGPKVEQNDWKDLLEYYWLTLSWVIFLLFLIIIFPFLAVCYCCFCCCRRCYPGCPPCERLKDRSRAFVFELLLALLIILIIIGLFIAFWASRTFDHGLQETFRVMKQGSFDTCRFLQDISNNIEHIFVYNYQELQEHLDTVLNEASTHIFLDLGDASESNALTELERILDNIPVAQKLMREVKKLEVLLRFQSAQLRDGLRQVKRDFIRACPLQGWDWCIYSTRITGIYSLDTSICLHLDKVPVTQKFLDGIKQIIDDEIKLIPKQALKRFQEIGSKIEAAMAQVVPPIQKDIARASVLFWGESRKIRNIIEAVISDIHLKTVRSTKSYEDLNEKYGYGRNIITIIACFLIFLILVLLIIAMICGCCFNRSSGSSCLLFALLVIFIAFSLVTLLGLLYYILGVITYQGACAPLRERDSNVIFRQLDTSIDLSKYIDNKEGESGVKVPPLRMSTAIKACSENMTIFDLLHKQRVYDIEDIEKIQIFTDEEKLNKEVIFNEDLSKVILFTTKEKQILADLQTGNLSDYHSVFYVENMCKKLSNLDWVNKKLEELVPWDEFHNSPKRRVLWTVFRYMRRDLDFFKEKFFLNIASIQDDIEKTLLKIDNLILYENREFKNSIKVLVNAVNRAETFLKTRGNDYINTLAGNLTQVIQEQMDTFIQGIIKECLYHVGACKPLSYIYYRGVDLICYRIVDPLNALWVGLLICALLLIPVVFLIHRLMCLWTRLHGYEAAMPITVMQTARPCPICTGAPYSPPPIITCSDGHKAFCVCAQTKRKDKRGGGGADSAVVSDIELPGQSNSMALSTVNEAKGKGKPSVPKNSDTSKSSKRKND